MFSITILIALILPTSNAVISLRPSSRSQAQSERTVSRTCYAEVKWNYVANLRRGPSESQYGVKRQMRWDDDPMRVFGQDSEGQWFQVYLPEPLNMIGWLSRENINLFGYCEGLPDNSATPEPESAPPAPEDVPLPDFALDIEFSETDQIYWVNAGMLYVRRESVEPLLQAHLLIVDLNAPQLDIQVEVGAVANVTNTLVSDMVKQAGGFAVINGDFYGGNYLPQGLTVVDYKVMIAPKFRATLAITEDHEIFMGYFTRDWTWQASVIAENGAFIPLQLLNLPCNDAWLCIYNEFLEQMPVKVGYDGLRVLLSPDFEVLDISESFFEIPKDHWVLRAGKFTEAGKWIQDNIKVGDTLEVYLTTTPAWEDFQYVISGGPIIVEEGEFRQDCDPELPDDERICEEFSEEYRNAHYFDNHMPRSGVGYDADNHVLIMSMVEGYEVTDSGGLTQREFAELFIAFGADQAMEFDGGGSASLWIDEGFVNDFGYRGERRVTNSLMLFWEE
jgi:hypothetical protein